MMTAQLIAASIKRIWKLDRYYWPAAAAVVVLYVAGSMLGFALASGNEHVTPVWPPTGLSLAVLLLLGRKYWRAIFLGAFLANALHGEPLLVAAGIGIGNTLEAVVAVFLLRKVLKLKDELHEPREALGFAIIAALSCAIAAAIGPLAVALSGRIGWSEYGETALVWWQGDLMSALLFAPLLIYYLDWNNIRALRGRWLEAGITLAVTFAITIIVFTSRSPSPLTFPYLIFPVAMWVAVRFTQLGVVTSTFIVATVAIWATMNGLGAFSVQSSLKDGLLRAEQYVCVLSATSLVLAMAIKERLTAEQNLQSQAHELERLDDELKDANRRVTNILAEILDGNGNGKRKIGSEQYDHDQL